MEIQPGVSQEKELLIPLWLDLVMKLKVSITLNLIENWDDYKILVESGSNAIIVNTHDEYLPVPEGYTEGEWTSKVADFMLNRWGTWVHAGGYPLYRVWHQNGTTEEWGEDGFKGLMSHIGKENVTCYPPSNWQSDKMPSKRWAQQSVGILWSCKKSEHECEHLAEFHLADIGHPINSEDFEKHDLNGFYGYQYSCGAIIRYSQDQSVFNFGTYLHLSAWKFYDFNGGPMPSDSGVGFISTAVAIYNEFSCVCHNLYGRTGNSAAEAIQEAETEGRAVGLVEARTSFQNAIDAFAAENYKLAAAYANQATQTAENATAPASNNLQIIAIIVTVGTAISIGIYYRINNKNKS